jgi:uncharacterized OB-fold protein
LKPQKTKDEYFTVNLSKNGKVKTFLIHRMVANAFLKNPNNYKEINHIDFDPSNNILSNLEFCSHL